jgi:ACS family hexuronate transporter-like MFS transporter
MAVGLFASGVSVGALLTPPLAAYLIVRYGWQFAFVAIGVPGLLWIAAWRAIYTPRPLQETDEGPECSHAGTSASRRWAFLLRQRLSWAVILGRFVEEPVGWLLYSWLPLYLANYRDVPLMRVGVLLMVPFLAQDLGFLVGGWAASHQLKRGWPVNRTRRAALGASALCVTACSVATLAATPLGFVLIISIAAFGHGAWSSNIMSLPADMLPHQSVGTLYGLSGCGGAVGSIVFTQVIGRLVDAQRSFDTVFLIGGMLGVAAVVLMFSVGGTLRPLAEATPLGIEKDLDISPGRR